MAREAVQSGTQLQPALPRRQVGDAATPGHRRWLRLGGPAGIGSAEPVDLGLRPAGDLAGTGGQGAVDRPRLAQQHAALGIHRMDRRDRAIRATGAGLASDPCLAHGGVAGSALVIGPAGATRLPGHGAGHRPGPSMIELAHAIHEAAPLHLARGDRDRCRAPTSARLAEQLRESAVRLQVPADHHRVVRLERLRDPIHERLRKAQRGAHLAHRRARPIRDQVGHHARVLDAVRLVDVLDDLLAAGRGEIDIDVRIGDPALVDEALEQQVVADGVDPGDAQRVGHDRITGAPPALGGDASLPREPDQVLADEEEPRQVGPPDDPQLVAEAFADLRGDDRVLHGIATADARPAQFRELLVRGPAVREGHGREMPALFAERRVTARGQLDGRVQPGVPGTLRGSVRGRQARRACRQLLA